MAVAKLGRYNERVVAMDVDTKNFTYSEIFKNEHPNRFIECYSAEQNMVGNYEVCHHDILKNKKCNGKPLSKSDKICTDCDEFLVKIYIFHIDIKRASPSQILQRGNNVTTVLKSDFLILFTTESAFYGFKWKFLL